MFTCPDFKIGNVKKRAHLRALRGTQSFILEVIEHEPLACDAAGITIITIMAQGSGGAVLEAARD